ncbi:MAG: Holliday junction resolvase RuvX [Campylobacter sp.]|nr:Holliday junction resolvase RuvX [Campylobacter sp.]
MSTAALDIGLKRIGIALGYKGDIVVPIDAVIRKNRKQAATDVKKVLKEYKVVKLIVGIPLGGSSEDEMRRRVEHFIGLLDFNGEIVYQDESFSSKEASALKVANLRKKDGKLDSLSAKIILERYLESNLNF